MAEKADKDRRGFHPLDLDLGLTKDCLSTVVLIRLIDLAASPILKVRVLTEARKVKALRSSVELWDSDTSKVPRRTNVKHYQTIVDMNGDGRADVVLQDKQAVRVCLNQGSQYGPSVQRVARRNADAQDHAAAAHSPGHPERERR